MSGALSGAWARRRAAVRAEAEADARAAKQAMIAERQEELAAKPEDEVLAELDLPQPDDMQAGDDFAAFMKETVPAALRNRALRKLWVSDPVLANVDGLVDYGEDFAAEGKLGAVVKTIYRVGKGLLSDEDLAETAAPEVSTAAPEPQEADHLETEDAPCEPVMYQAPAEPVDEIYETTPVKRKMKFEFQEIRNE